jgi:multiple sugar transport system substrate-binding protein
VASLASTNGSIEPWGTVAVLAHGGVGTVAPDDQEPCMRRISTLVPATTTAAGLLLLAACAGGGGGSDETTTADPADFEGLELTMWHGVPYDPFMTLNADQLAACGDEIGVTVTAEALPSDQFLTSVLQAASSGDLPDILMGSSANLAQYAEGGLLADLSQYGITTDGLAEATAEMGYYEDTLVGVASHVEVGALEYNPDLFETVGAEPPATFEELREVAAELTTDDVYGIALPGISADGSGDFFLMSFILSAGGDPSDPTDPGTIAAIQLYKDLVEDGSMSAEMVNWGWDFQDPFNAGTAAMTVNGPWATAPSEGQAPREFALPPTEGDNAPASAVIGFEWVIPVSEDETAMAAAAEIITCRLSVENQLEIAQQQAYIPANTEAAEQWASENPAVAPFVELVPNAYSHGTVYGEDWGAISTMLGNAIQYAVVGGMSAEEALEKAASE